MNCNSLVVLNYHQIVETAEFLPDWCSLTTEQFQIQMEYLATYFEVVAVRDGIRRFEMGELGEKPMAAITFDDGYLNNYSDALPILKKLQLPATIFLVTGMLNSDETIWSCKLNQALYETSLNRLHWNGQVYQLSTLKEKITTYRRLQNDLKRFPHPTLLEHCHNIVVKLGGDELLSRAVASTYRMLDDAALSEMLDSGLIDFGAHTRDHVILDRVENETQQLQIHQSINDIRAITNRNEVLFAYPNGGPSDYNTYSVEELNRAGVQYAFTTISGLNKQPIRPLELKRIGVGGDWQLGLFMFAIHTGLTP